MNGDDDDKTYMLSFEAMNIIFNTLMSYASEHIYSAPRIGGVTAGCPRGPVPTSHQIAMNARMTIRYIEREVLKRPTSLFDEAWEEKQAADRVPIDMILHCPVCHTQHIDAPGTLITDDSGDGEYLWTNPPHRSHLCHGCGCIWRPADVPTNGVKAITTRGKADTWPNNSPDGGKAQS